MLTSSKDITPKVKRNRLGMLVRSGTEIQLDSPEGREVGVSRDLDQGWEGGWGAFLG